MMHAKVTFTNGLTRRPETLNRARAHSTAEGKGSTRPDESAAAATGWARTRRMSGMASGSTVKRTASIQKSSA